jgi:AcrR family transcriptional regulator
MKIVPRRTAPGTAREKLLQAAIDLFGMRGFDGVSTRAIAARARVNIAGIAYQFGGKEELYRACTEYIAETVHARLVAGALQDTAGLHRLAPAEAVAALRAVISRFARFLLAAPELDRFARIVVREQMDPTPAFEPLYRLVFEPMHTRLCALWAAATGSDPGSEDVKLKVFTIISQLMFFRIARTAALRRLGWQAIGPDELARIEAVVMESLDASLARHGQGGSS